MNPIEFKDSLVKNVIKPSFKQAGFKISGIHFIKEEEGFAKIFNVQSSQFNLNPQCSFYFNIGLFFPMAWSFRYAGFIGEEIEAPKVPKVTDCQFYFRSDKLTKRPGGYLIDQHTNYETFTMQVKKDINEAILPFFNKLSSLEDCLAIEKEIQYATGSTTAFIGLTYASLNDHAKAGEILTGYLKNDLLPANWRKKIETEARKRNIEI